MKIFKNTAISLIAMFIITGVTFFMCYFNPIFKNNIDKNIVEGIGVTFFAIIIFSPIILVIIAGCVRGFKFWQAFIIRRIDSYIGSFFITLCIVITVLLILPHISVIKIPNIKDAISFVEVPLLYIIFIGLYYCFLNGIFVILQHILYREKKFKYVTHMKIKDKK